MKKIAISGSYVINCGLNNYEMRVDDETYVEMAWMQREERWEELDATIQEMLEEDIIEVINGGMTDTEYEGDDVVIFIDEQED